MNDTASSNLANPWRVPTLAWVALFAAIVGLYWPTGRDMVGIWYRSETFAHAFLVPPMVLWLVWRKRQTLQTLTPQPAPWMLLPIALIAFGWMLGELVAVNSVTHFALVAMLVLSVPAVFGIAVARALMFPLVFSFFAVPAGEFLLPTLMQWTADFAVAALRVSGVPVYREGLKFVIPSGSWSVVEECSGIRYLIASLMVGSLFAYLNYRSLRRRWIFIGLSILVPIVANWLRAYIIVMLGHLSGNKIAAGADHLIYGWVFFGFVIMLLFMIGARWAEPDEPTPMPVARGTGTRAGERDMQAWLPMASAALFAALVALPPLVLHAWESATKSSTEVKLALPDELGTWRQITAPVVWEPVFVNPTATAERTFADGSGRWVGVRLFYYRQQANERKLVSSTNVMVRADDRQWTTIASAGRKIATDAGKDSVDVSETRLLGVDIPGNPLRPSLRIWQVYWINGVWTNNGVKAKLLNAWDRLRGRGDDSAAFILVTSDAQPDAAVKTLASFITAHRGAIEASLSAARDNAAP